MCDGDVNVRKSGRGCALYFRGASKSSVPHSPVGNTVAQGLGHGIPECCTRLDVALADCHHEQSTLSLWCPGERHFDMKNGVEKGIVCCDSARCDGVQKIEVVSDEQGNWKDTLLGCDDQ